MKEKVTRLNCCQYLLVSQINYTLMNLADHCKQFPDVIGPLQIAGVSDCNVLW
jgi:hypothetical protein